MSLDISVYANVAGESICLAETNWLRNPFGLCQIIEDNVGEVHPKKSLYDVINQYGYGKNQPIDRKEFLEVVEWYVDKFCALPSIECHIKSLDVWKQFFPKRPAKAGEFPKKVSISFAAFHLDGGLGSTNTTVAYKEWAMELKRMAQLLQDEETDLYVSN